MSGPLDGIRVVEFAGLGPCPLAGQFLADLGADVILIDRTSGLANPAMINNRGKKSLALNLKSEAGKEVALRLIARSDILIEGFRPGVMERMGLGPEPCLAANPALIFGRMTGWGQDGPMSQTAGHDINYLGLTGLLEAIGPADEPPPPPLNVAADYGGGTMFLLLGVLSAYIARQTSGTGQVVDAAMVDGASALMAMIHGLMAMGRWDNRREHNMLDGAAPYYRNYRTRDGRFVSVGAIEPQFHAILLERAGLPADHQTSQNDKSSWPERRAQYAAVFATKTRDEWAEIFADTDACVAPILDWQEAMAHPHMSARQAFVTVEGVVQPAPAPRFGGHPAMLPQPPPAPGADSEAVLAELGFGEAEVDELRRSGVLT